MSWAEFGLRPAGARLGKRPFELVQRTRPRILDVAERRELAQVLVHRPLPRAIVGPSPLARVTRRSGIRKHRDRPVRPDAVALQVRAPGLDLVGIVAARLE